MRLESLYGDVREKIALVSFLTYLGLALQRNLDMSTGHLRALKVTLVTLKVAHFPDDSSPDGVDICQWGREGLEASLLGGESHMGSRARDILNAAWVPTSQ